LQGDRVEYQSEVLFQGVGHRVLHFKYTPERNDRGEVVEWIDVWNKDRDVAEPEPLMH